MEPTHLTPEEAKAALGNATFLTEQMLHQHHAPQQQGEQVPQEQQADASAPPVSPSIEEINSVVQNAVSDGLQANSLDGKLEEFKKETQDTIKTELEGIKNMLKKALE